MHTPAISVVIPSYNSRQWVTEAVESALAQTLPPAQIIVVDDGSKDDTRQRLAAYRDRGVAYVYQNNGGVSKARNNGVARATGEFVAFLDADDVWHPRKLELQGLALSRRPGLGMLGTARYSWPGLPSAEPQQPDAVPLTEISWAQLAVKNYFTTSSVVARRSALVDAGPFDSSLSGPEDYDLWLRIAAKFPVANLKMPLVGCRSVSGSLSKNATTMEAGMMRILKRLDQEQAWALVEDRQLRRKAYAYARFSCAYMYGASGNQAAAIRRVLHSMLAYPTPFTPDEVTRRFARPKLLVILLLRLFRIIQNEPS